MNISELVIKKVNIPFKLNFKHSSADRATTQSVWVEATSENRLIGYGEGCPREYVTNESIATAVVFFNKHKYAIISQVKNVATLKVWIQNNKAEIDKNPASWCAIELAVLDLIAKEEKKSIENVIDLPELNMPFKYSAVLGDSSLEVFTAQTEQYLAKGFTDFKIKISGDLNKDLDKLKLFKGQQKVRVRLDANNLWKEKVAAIDYINSLDFPFFAIEEPLTSGMYNDLNEIGEACKIKIILDESFLRIENFKNIVGSVSNWIINLRISKMGGLIRSSEIIRKAQTLGIGIIIGAQVGETSLLTRAALTIANSCRDILIAQEGAFGTLLLQSDICNPPLMFKENGLLQFSPSKKYGFQFEVSAHKDLFV